MTTCPSELYYMMEMAGTFCCLSRVLYTAWIMHDPTTRAVLYRHNALFNWLNLFQLVYIFTGRYFLKEENQEIREAEETEKWWGGRATTAQSTSRVYWCQALAGWREEVGGWGKTPQNRRRHPQSGYTQAYNRWAATTSTTLDELFKTISPEHWSM